MITFRKRVVQFVQKWVIAVRHAVFDDPIVCDFIEVSPLTFDLVDFFHPLFSSCTIILL